MLFVIVQVQSGVGKLPKNAVSIHLMSGEVSSIFFRHLKCLVNLRFVFTLKIYLQDYLRNIPLRIHGTNGIFTYMNGLNLC